MSNSLGVFELKTARSSTSAVAPPIDRSSVTIPARTCRSAPACKSPRPVTRREFIRIPYVETLTVLEGSGEVWLDGDDRKVALEPGITVTIPAGRKHGFRAVGDKPLVTLGIHMHGRRVVDYVESSR